jgi:hypothetical protein
LRTLYGGKSAFSASAAFFTGAIYAGKWRIFGQIVRQITSPKLASFSHRHFSFFAMLADFK